jgi:chemotaxis protein methyltransferase CheR
MALAAARTGSTVGARGAPRLEREFTLTDCDFRFIADLVYRQAGILLGERKRNLVYGRLVRRLRALGLPDFGAYCAHLQAPEGAAELGLMINALTTNLTAFFREPHHFDHLGGTVLPEAAAGIGAPRRRLRVWSAACSTGEEPYSIAMTLLGSAIEPRGWDIRVLATDLDTSVLATASEGVYAASAAAKVPTDLRGRFLERLDDGRLRIARPARQLITFKQLNLLTDWPMRGPFDVIFCRNVLIYFDAATKARLIDRFVALLRLGGWLYLGHSESLSGGHPALGLTGRTIYRRAV